MKIKLLSLVAVVLALAAAADQQAPHKVALIVQNHTAPATAIPLGALTDALTARLAGKGFQVVNPYNAVGETENRTPVGEPLPKMSAMELAQGLGAEGAITASVIEFLDTTIGTPPIAHRYVVRVAFSLADAQTGAAVCGETIKVTSPQYTIAQHTANRLEYLSDLLHSAADQCAELLVKKAAGWKPTPPPPPVVVVPPQDKQGGDVVVLTSKRPESPRGKLLQKTPPPVAEDFTMADFDKMFESLVAAMLDSSRFKENYEQAEAEKSGLPIVIVGGVMNKSEGAAAQAYAEFLEAIPDTLRIELFNSNLFDVKHDELSVMFAQRILASDKSPIEDGELMNALKQHGSPDFVILGDIRLFADQGNRKTCRFHLALHSLKTGKVVWEGKKTAVK